MTVVNFRKQRERSLPVAFTLALLANVLLVFIPLPIGPMRKRLIGYSRKRKAGCDTVFFCHPDIVCTAHLVWIGWLVAGAGAYDILTASRGWWVIPMQPLYWLWTCSLLLTVIVLGLQFNRVACGFLVSGSGMLAMGALLIQKRVETPFLGEVYRVIEAIPVEIAWGVPLIVSAVLGCVFAITVAWQSLNDVWILPHDEDYIEHHTFLEKDRSISRGALNFVAVFPCLVRRFLLFGYGNVEVRLATGTLKDTIEGVFLAQWHAAQIRRRLSASRRSAASERTDLPQILQQGGVDAIDDAEMADDIDNDELDQSGGSFDPEAAA